MNYCSNCGSVNCGCMWSEKLEAARIKERKRRQELAKEGRPVSVDHQRGLK